MKAELIRRVFNKDGPVDLMSVEGIEDWVEPGLFVLYKRGTIKASIEDRATHIIRGVGGNLDSPLIRCEVLGLFQPTKRKTSITK